MELYILAGIVVLIIVGIVFFKLLKNSFKAFSLLFFTALFVLVVLVFFFIQDMQVFQESFSEKKTIYLLEDNGSFSAGFLMYRFNLTSFEPVPLEELDRYFEEESDRIRIVIRKNAMDSTLQTNMTQGYSLASAIESPDYAMRASAFMVGTAALIRSDSLWGIARHIRSGDIAVFPQSFAIRVLTFNSNDYKDEFLSMYEEQKEAVYDSLGVRVNEVNAS